MKKQNWLTCLLPALAACLFSYCLRAQQPAFPGAEGFGKYTSGGRGGRVLVVSTLADSGPGSLRAAVNTKGPRIIVFAVSGTIALQSPLQIRHNDVTIAGQSAPGDGICIRNYPTYINADNVIIRYLRFRLGDEAGQESDALGARKHRNIIIDHCSLSWSVDECASFYWNRDFTMQWCIVSESLNRSVHVKGAHGYGGIWGGEKASFHHNLLACHNSRNPRLAGSATTRNPEGELVDFRNNVIYNWMGNSIYGGEQGQYNLVNNYYKPGPATPASKRSRIVNPSRPYGRFYVHGNYVHGDKQVSRNNWNGGVQCDSPAATKAATPFEVLPLPPQSALQAYGQVLQKAGASLYRDAVDSRIVAEVRSGRSSAGALHNGIIDTPADVGGWPELRNVPPPADTDSDGMPDTWEAAHGLHADNPADAAAHQLDPGYTNVEVYLNSLAAK
ncbi:pectate lyase family protein [Chitinophaga japonensis]|uniref:Pectate lyase n=1 Tax=Chitinophaga japonensis TaxID=104662 RepID=A0A562T5J6_CHIJA|nr:pectate lyase [Chitinophaga japonensis]TWI88524.1 hypothetical protein LX66_2609 [Chitinophaga japonensis]